MERYDEDDGLSQRHITQMLQDRQGMIWFSTWNGLCRYDGYGFQCFKAHVGDGSGPSSDRIRNIWLTEDGNIGCLVDESLYVFNLRTYHFEKREALVQGEPSAKFVSPSQPFTYKDRWGVTWTVASNGTLHYQEPDGEATTYPLSPALVSARFCMPDRQGHLWVIAENSVYKLCFPHQSADIQREASMGEAKTFFVDCHRRYWVATKGDAAVRIFNKDNHFIGYLSASGKVTKSFSRFVHPVYSISQTHDGNVWLGTKPGGLFCLKQKGNNVDYDVKKVEGLNCDAVYDVKADRFGRLWIATLGGGVNCIVNPNDDTPNILSPTNGLKGYPKGVALKTRHIHITKDDIMFVTTTEGLLVTKMLRVSKEREMRFRLHTREAERADALSCSATMNIAEDWHGRIFVSTESGGVNLIKGNDFTTRQLSFQHYDESLLLPTDIALSVADLDGRLVVVGSNQLTLFYPDDINSSSFGRGFFLDDCHFSDAVPVCLPDGRWLFGLQDGTCTINPAELHKSDYVPSLAFTGLNVQGFWRDIPINAIDTLVLSPQERSFTLTFAALDYAPNASLSYEFSLDKEEYDEYSLYEQEWNNVERNHSATLLDLSPGTYTLFVRSTNADGLWVDNVRRLTLVVTPRFSETTTAHLLLLLLFGTIVGGMAYTYIYIRRIRRQRREALEAYLTLLNTGKPDATPAPQPVQQRLDEEDDALMRRVSAFVDAHISDADTTVGDMAEAAAVSRSGLQRKMKQIMGVTPLDFLREARIKRACHLLSTTDMNISEVAYASGFSDPKYFSRAFKASVGKPPKEYRG